MNEMVNEKTNKNIKWYNHKITLENRRKLTNNKNKVLWFTGLSGSGKSTIANEVEQELHKKGILTYVLDGDNVRHGLNKNLGFSPEDRKENIRRIAQVTKLLYDAGLTVLVCFISPYKSERKLARDLIGEDFIEVYVKCSLEECETRDTKGLYKKARAGEIKDFTGISAPYEEPEEPEVVIETDKEDLGESVNKVVEYLK